MKSARQKLIRQRDLLFALFQRANLLLTRNGGGNFWMHPKIWCLNFKPQYLQNYVSPTNDLYSVRKRSIRAFKSNGPQNFARVVSLAAVQLVLKHARAPFDLILSPVV